MVIEFAEIEVKPGMQREFIQGVENARPIFARAAGCHGITLKQCIEMPEKFVLKVKWDSVAHHTDLFVNSPDFSAWRALVGHCFAGKPNVFHTETLVEVTDDAFATVA